jgi:DNA polymerase-3 subunit gamma/tau
MDKIVSFTNGKLTYQNTLEHLNILDADYYFKLIDCMLKQDLAGAMLLYDDINKKGFEGDLVLNGLSEFIRKLLVCKDERVANLLEAVESFREKYISTAKNIAPAFLISALYIIIEAEIHYKAARNKRLHVELVLIKLCYLQQAIELSADTSGLSKKKVVETSLGFRTAAIKPFKVENKKTTDPLPQAMVKKQSEAKLVIETSLVKEEVSDYKSDPEPRTHPSLPQTTKLSALDKIRKQVKGNGNNGNGNSGADTPLELERLQAAWNEYVQKLKSEKNPAGTNFEMAELKIQDTNSFIAIVTNNIQLRFIEQGGQKASQFLREKLHNDLLTFFIVMEENKEEKIPVGTPLTSREQFLKMTERYPLVKELKDRLRLELDY